MGIAINGNTVNGLAIGGQAFQPVTISDGEIKVGNKTYDLDTTQYFVPNDGNITIHQSDVTYQLRAGKKYPILSDITDEYNSRYLGIYVDDNISTEYGRDTGVIVEVTGSYLDEGKIVGGVISLLNHLYQRLSHAFTSKGVRAWA